MFVSLNLYATDGTSNSFSFCTTVQASKTTVYLFLYEYKLFAIEQLEATYSRLALQRPVEHPPSGAASETQGARGWITRKGKRVAEDWFELAARLGGDKGDILHRLQV
jgi:hypothetical protein